MSMPRQVLLALAHPVFDPIRQMRQDFTWVVERHVSGSLSCNIGME